MTKTESMRPLNTTDGWEDIVNPHAAEKGSARERVAARCKERETRKLLVLVCALAVAAICAVIFGAAGAMHGAVATFTAGVCAGLASFMFGRYVEVRK